MNTSPRRNQNLLTAGPSGLSGGLRPGERNPASDPADRRRRHRVVPALLPRKCSRCEARAPVMTFSVAEPMPGGGGDGSGRFTAPQLTATAADFPRSPRLHKLLPLLLQLRPPQGASPDSADRGVERTLRDSCTLCQRVTGASAPCGWLRSDPASPRPPAGDRRDDLPPRLLGPRCLRRATPGPCTSRHGGHGSLP